MSRHQRRILIPKLFLTFALCGGIGAIGCQPPETGTVGVPRPLGPDGQPLPVKQKGGPEAPAKSKARGKTENQLDPGGK